MSLKEIRATQEIMRIALNGQNHVDALIGYYRDKIDKFNEEKMQWAQYYEFCKDKVADRALLQRQISHQQNKTVDLENELASLKGDLTFQRQKYFQRIQMNQNIKQNLEENKKRLTQLNQLCKPLNMQNSRVKSAYSVKTKAYDSAHKPQVNQKKYMVNQTKTQLQLEMVNMTKAYQEKKSKLQKVIDQLKEELQELVSEHSSRHNECNREYFDSLNRLSTLEKKHMSLVSEFFKYRCEGLENQQKLQEENQVIRLKNVALYQKLKSLQENHTSEFKSVENEVKKKNKEFKEKYDEELRKREEHLSILKEQHQRISDLYLNKLKKLEAELTSTTEKTKTIEQKTKVEVSSLKSQIKILTNRLQNVAMNEMRKNLINGGQESEEESSVTLQMEQLQRINKEVKNLEKQIINGKQN